MMHKMFSGMCVLILLGVAHALVAERVSLTLTDDTYTDLTGWTNYTENYLYSGDWLEGGHHELRSMLKFDLVELEDADIVSAVLHIRRVSSCGQAYSSYVDAYGITEAWEEESWNWKAAIAHDDIVWGSASMVGYVWVDIDITDLVSDWVTGVKENHGVVLIAPFGEHWSKYVSKDNLDYPDYHPYLEIEYMTTGIEVEDSTPYPVPLAETGYLLNQNTPNPFNPATLISFTIPPKGAGAPVMLKIYDVRGRMVRTLIDGRLSAGHHTSFWNGHDDSGRMVASGAYLCRLEWDGGAETRRMFLVR
jgi:hypothetical protein